MLIAFANELENWSLERKIWFNVACRAHVPELSSRWFVQNAGCRYSKFQKPIKPINTDVTGYYSQLHLHDAPKQACWAFEAETQTRGIILKHKCTVMFSNHSVPLSPRFKQCRLDGKNKQCKAIWFFSSQPPPFSPLLSPQKWQEKCTFVACRYWLGYRLKLWYMTCVASSLCVSPKDLSQLQHRQLKALLYAV